MPDLSKLIYAAKVYDSLEEVWIAKWLEELKQHGYVTKWEKITEPIFKLTDGLKIAYKKTTQLKTKVKEEIRTHALLRPSEYTPDFKIIFSPTFFNTFVSYMYIDNFEFNPNAPFFSPYDWEQPVYIEVKPNFDQNNMERLFVLNQKFVWDKYKEFINLVKPIELFQKTFLPSLAVTDFKLKKTPTKGKNAGKRPGDWKVSFIPKTLEQFINGQQ